MESALTRSLEEELAHRLQAEGRITFAQFMDLALYWPRGGYYRGPSPTGADGDFYTAPGAHPAFGSLLCLQLYQMWRLLESPNPFWVVEAGAGSGLLCRDVVRFAHSLPNDFHRSLQYLCLDPSLVPGLKEGNDGGADPNPLTCPTGGDETRIQPLVTNGLPLAGVVGCIVSNELLDAFPVHVVENRGGRLLEVYVTLRDGCFVEEMDEPSTPALRRRLDSLGIELAEGQRAEVNLAMTSWLGEAAQALKKGYVVTIDYGREAAELYSHERFRGTLTTFYRHTQTDNPYVRIGRQDMTSQVDFTTLKRLGEGYGLTNLGYLTQGRFLSNLGLRRWIARLPALGLTQPQRDANRMGMLQLIRPGGMGDFKVLVQARDVPDAPMWGLQPSRELEDLAQRLDPPLLTDRHVPLLQGRYPFYGTDVMDFGPC